MFLGGSCFWGVHPLLMYRYEINAIYSGRSRPSDKGLVGGGGVWGHSDPEIRGRGRSPIKHFWIFGPQFGLKIRWGPPLDLTLPAPCWVTLSCNPEKLIPSYCTPSRGVGLQNRKKCVLKTCVLIFEDVVQYKGPSCLRHTKENQNLFLTLHSSPVKRCLISWELPCQGDMTAHLLEVLAMLWVGVCVLLALSLSS